jgi:hypothetical protein
MRSPKEVKILLELLLIAYSNETLAEIIKARQS